MKVLGVVFSLAFVICASCTNSNRNERVAEWNRDSLDKTILLYNVIDSLKNENERLKRELLAKVNYSSLEDAVKYLDGNERWNRSEMEKYSYLRGLWKALNERDFYKVLEWENKLSSSKRFKEMVETIRRGMRRGNYTREGDSVITVSAYIDKLRDIVVICRDSENDKWGKKSKRKTNALNTIDF